MGSGMWPVISVNSSGYATRPGMAGPKLSGTSAFCVFDAAANTTTFPVNLADGAARYAIACNQIPEIKRSTSARAFRGRSFFQGIGTGT